MGHYVTDILLPIVRSSCTSYLEEKLLMEISIFYIAFVFVDQSNRSLDKFNLFPDRYLVNPTYCILFRHFKGQNHYAINS